MRTFAIRKARQEDREAIVDCVRRAYSRYSERMQKPPAPLLADYQARIAEEVVYVLEVGDRILGALVMMPQGRSLFVENIAVDPSAQGHGFGRALMAFAEQQALTQLLSEIRLYTNELMTESLRFYLQLGFQEEERRIEDGYHRVFLRKAL